MQSQLGAYTANTDFKSAHQGQIQEFWLGGGGGKDMESAVALRSPLGRYNAFNFFVSR